MVTFLLKFVVFREWICGNVFLVEERSGGLISGEEELINKVDFFVVLLLAGV